MTFREAADRFVELTVWIRELSSPQLTNINDEEAYREKLLINFRRIGEIAGINNSLLSEELMPVLEGTRPLSEEEIAVLLEVGDKLLDAYAMDNLDVPFLNLIATRLCDDAEQKQDTEAIIQSLDNYVMAAYALLAMVRRLHPYCDFAIKCREAGLLAANRILEYLPPEKLATLPEGPARKAVLINSRYIATLYEYPLLENDSELTETIMRILRRALSLAHDPEYRKLVPDFDWLYHEFRTLHYFSVITIFHNSYGFNKEQLAKINGYAKRFLEIWEKEQENLHVHNTSETIRFAVIRCAYLAGDIDVVTYREELRALIMNARKNDYSADAMQLRTSAPMEYMLTLDPKNISIMDGEIITGFYKQLIRYIHEMPKLGHLSFLLTELVFLLDHFIEVEGGIDFETMCMELLAAIHPPTYVHSMSVADLSVCLAKHLFRKNPELFENTPGYPDSEAMREHVWHAAVCHDIGKLFIVETIITYGRPLYDYEVDWIRSHPEAGAALLSKYEKTKDYAEAALGHQRWYDGKGGYPESYQPKEAKNRLVVDLIACADCLDAATDNVGRSYKKGKTLDEFIAEVKAGRGTRYAPYLPELLEDEAVRLELETILNAGRDDKYRHTYTILDSVLH